MKADPRIRRTWLRLLKQANRPGDIKFQKIEDGYYAVVHRPLQGMANAGPNKAEYAALRTFIPNFDRTRAVPLNFHRDSELTGISQLKTWAGDWAAEVVAGDLRPFAIVDAKLFEVAAIAEVRAAGWKVAAAQDELRITDGAFVQRVNLLRAIVEMVTSRSDVAEAQRAMRENIARDCSLYRKLFLRFARRFQEFGPAVLDHYFTAYPGGCCVSAGWDYWEVKGRTLAAAKGIFERAMEEFHTFLTTACPHTISTAREAEACQWQAINI